MLAVPGLAIGGRGGFFGTDGGNKVQILSLQTITLNPDILHPRQKNESIIDFAKREIEGRQLKLAKALESSLAQLKNDPFDPSVTFFTAPEIYWNIPWQAVKNKDELHQLSYIYNILVKKQIQKLIKKFPATEWGRLILLPGTNALLLPSKQNVNRYEAINYVLAANNFGPGLERGVPYFSMWPKRYTAGIDFLGLSVDINVEGEDTIIYTYHLSDGLSVEVYELSEITAQHDTRSGHAPLFNNQILTSIPYGVTICADVGFPRLEEFIRPDIKLDFLIAAGQYVPKGSDFPKSVQYLIRNDGKNGLSADGTKQIPQCETWRVTNGKTSELVQGRLLDNNVWVYQLDVT
ncbi:hypothetical protein EC912_105272 [Luteibacter rhizovicinus]|uniref:CN hydrolase domain-containing protein n=2 Tax=Luteibacter rhizovicinus TaxID=242606 RepID=A0A4R3YMB9_9GAMM|nr:hypothetical protein EC912_105272 [Luteibacter rhizovicinus]